MKTTFRFLLLWFIFLILTLLFVLPATNVYQTALLKFDDAIESQNITVPPPPKDAPYRYGFAVGYILNKFPIVLAATFLMPLVFTILFMLTLRWLGRGRPRSVLLTDPLDFIKNVLSNLLLFMFGVFNRRASKQLVPYFDMSLRSRIVGVLAYALIFFALTFSYKIPDNLKQFSLHWLNYAQVLFIVLLLSLTLFNQKFRVNYQRRLFWLSLSALIIVLGNSLFLGFRMAQDQLYVDGTSAFDTSIFDTHTLIINILVVLAFSFYIEIMKQVATQKAHIEAEMSVAQRIQNDLLPDLNIDNDVFSLYGRTVSASEVGGDYCDAVELDDGRHAIAVGDVAGHNVSAGVMMSMLKVAFRTELGYLTTPENMIASLNRNMYDHKNKNIFVSLIKTLIDPEHKRLTVVNCGHPPLLYYSAQTESIEEIRTGDLALALDRNATFSSHSLTYQAGDALLLYSDGLIETAKTNGDELGLEPIIDLFKENISKSAQEIYETLLNASNTFRGAMPQRDDVTIVVVKLQ